MSDKTQTAFIFARGGSKGVTDKNIRPVAGKPLIAHSILCALQSRYVGRVIVSTDSGAIAAVAREYGAEVLARPKELAEDTSPELLAWRHAVASNAALFAGKNALFISLPATSPLRAPQDVDAAVERYRQGGCDIVFGIAPSHRSPYLNMVSVDEKGLIGLVIPGSKAVRRQDVPPVYDITTCVYVSGAGYVETCASLMQGRVGYVEIPPQRALDIDDEYDLYLADLMLAHPFGAMKGVKP